MPCLCLKPSSVDSDYPQMKPKFLSRNQQDSPQSNLTPFKPHFVLGGLLGIYTNDSKRGDLILEREVEK